MMNGHTSSRADLYLEGQDRKRPSLASIAEAVIKNEAAKTKMCCQSDISCNNFSSKIASFLQKSFNSFGQQIGKRPWLTIILSVALAIVCTAGMVFWNANTDDEALWTPYGSPFIRQREWILENFPKDTRYETVIMSASEADGNVLNAETMQYLLKVHLAVTNITSQSNYTYDDLCLDLPNMSENSSSSECATKSLLKIWNYDEDVIEKLTDDQVLQDVSLRLSQQELLEPLDQIANILSGVVYDNQTGRVVKASALMNIWLMRQNGTKEVGGSLVDVNANQWEKVFIDQIIVHKVGALPLGIKFDALAERSFDDAIEETVNSNFQVMFGGFFLIFIYIALTLGRWNAVEQRVVLSLMGIMVIALSLGASFGFCFYLGIFFADMHPIIPFLLLGIGVDDMYVIVQALDNLSKADRSGPVHLRIGKAMEHAGVSITVTSLTDMAAFLIGSSTSMPILRAFCLFAAMGVLFLYFFAITFFVGCLTLDEKRIDARKVYNSDCIAPKPEDWKPNACSSRDHGRNFFENMLAPFLAKPYVKVLVILLTIGLACLGAYGVYSIELNYDSIWYMDQKSYQTHYFKALQTVFPENGERVEVYVGQIPYWHFSEEMFQLQKVLNSTQYIRQDSVEFWYPKFHEECCGANSKSYCFDMFDWSSELTCYDELGFKRKLMLFLKEHHFYAQDMRFNISLEDLDEESAMDHYIEGSFEITASRARFQHNHLENTAIKTKAMSEVKDGLNRIQLNSSEHFDGKSLESPIAYAFIYVQWDANQIISDELIRNLSITFATIAVVSILLIVNIQICAMVFVCVVLTVMNVCGFAHYMGLTIEIVTSIILILSVGLALDYAAHVGVIFACLTSGTREEKVKQTLGEIGSAVLNGGLSTFLAFILLSTSDSYVFLTFFLMFGMVVLFGLYHGLIFLPVVLSLFGPSSPKIDPPTANGIHQLSNGHVNQAAEMDVEKL